LEDVADSDKEMGVDKGFRGIGRLGGLAYCDTLNFITTMKGENIKTIMTWDAKKLLNLIQDKNAKNSAGEMINEVISYSTEPCHADEHFFIVEMLGVRKENRELLDVKAVRKYISSNAPIPYSNKFLYRSKIYEFINKEKLKPNEYIIYINDEDIYKNYGTYLYENVSGQPKKYDEIFDIQIKKFERENGELLAWMWYGVSRFEKAIPESINEMRGIRLRQSNIQLGDDRTLSKFFKESRGNSYFVGEVHAVHKGLIPNARRDYFNENTIRIELEILLEEYFGSLHKLYHDANKAKNAFKRDILLKQKEAEYHQKKQNGFVNDKERAKIEQDIESKKAEYTKARKELCNLREKTSESEPLGKVIKKIEEAYQPEIDKIVKPIVNGKQTKSNLTGSQPKTEYFTQNLSKLDKKQQKLVARIYGVINDVLPGNLSQELIKKIQEELNK
jgi:molecular chaperone HtpG